MTAPHLFSAIPDGPRIVMAYERLQVANAMTTFAATNEEAREQRRQALNAPLLQEFLPGLGYRPTFVHGSDDIVHHWTLYDDRSAAVIRLLKDALTITVTVPDNPLDLWTTVQHTLTAAAVETALAQVGLDQPCEIFDLPTLVAFAVAKNCTTTLEHSWTITPEAITRRMPPWPLRTPIDREPKKLVLDDKKGTPVPCHAWVVDIPVSDRDTTAGEAVFISMSGSAALLKMAKAQWTPRSNRTPYHGLPLDSGKRLEGGVNKRATWFSSSVGTHIHALYIDERVLKPTLPHFYHVTGPDGVPDWTLLYDQLNRCLLIPIEYTSIEALWTQARLADTGLIIPLKSSGCQGYKIMVDSLTSWADLIGQVTGVPMTVTIRGASPDDPAHQADPEPVTTDS